MGLVLKGLAVLVGLMLLPLGGWLVSALLFLYAFSGVIFRVLRGRPQGTAQAPTAHPQAPRIGFSGNSSHPFRITLGAVFLCLSVVAFAAGGTYSPLVFGAVGVVLLLPRVPRMRRFGFLRPVEESVILRGRFNPFRWAALAEVKLATSQAGRALGGIDETLLIDLSAEGPSVLVVIGATALTRVGAEKSILQRMGELARVSAPLGAYILPLDSEDAARCDAMRGVEPVELEARGWPSALSNSDYDMLVVDSERGGFVHAVGAYKTSSREGRGPSLPPARQALSRPSLLWEVFQELGKRAEWRKPDGFTTFLASIFATGGEAIGERISEAGESQGSQVLVQSLGTPPVRMSRAQLRAIFRVYS